jgi:hypothetical protein
MAYMRHMKSMELDDDSKLDTAASFPALTKTDYPCGLRISLSEKEFEKLGLDHMEAEVDGMVHGHFIGRITHVSHGKGPDDEPCCRVEIQIEDLGIESEDEENEEEE